MPNIVPRKYADMQRDFANECNLLATQVWTMYMQNANRCLYLVGKRKTGLDTLNPSSFIWTEFTFMDEYEDKAEWVYVNPEPLSRNAIVEVLEDTITKILKREPLWIFAD